MKKFEIGKTYYMRSACNHECVWKYTVTARTACTVTLEDEKGEIKRCRINKYITNVNNVEAVLPLGNYSMSPTLSADRISE